MYIESTESNFIDDFLYLLDLQRNLMKKFAPTGLGTRNLDSKHATRKGFTPLNTGSIGLCTKWSLENGLSLENEETQFFKSALAIEPT